MSDDKLPFSIPVVRSYTTGSSSRESSPDGMSTSSELTHNEITVYVGQVGFQRRKPLGFRRGNKIPHLTEKIERIYELKSTDDIVIYEPVGIPGSISTQIPVMSALAEYDGKELLFYVPSPPNLDEIKDMCCDQNIVLIGAPGHGKSSFINTVMKSLEKPSVAPTYKPDVVGTRVYTPYHITLPKPDESDATKTVNFTLFDVPGTAIMAIDEGRLQETMKSILLGKQPPNIEIGRSTRWYSRDFEKVQAVISVQNGTAAIERMHSSFLQAVTETGRTIPMFVVMTHIDEMGPEDIEVKVREIAENIGIDPSQIFPIANYDHSGRSVVRSNQDPQREFYTRTILTKILAASKSYKDETGQSGSCTIL